MASNETPNGTPTATSEGVQIAMPDLTRDRRIRIVIGHYGSGKTEFSVNYALALRRQVEPVTLCDLDIVNPYFRSRERAALLEDNGITVISGARGHAANLDIPMVSAGILGPIQNPEMQVVLDVGGDAVGARVLARFAAYFKEGAYDMFFVLNANREQTQDVAGVMTHIRNIEDTVGAPVTALVNNTHLLRYTTAEEVRKGQALAQAVSETSGIPLRYVSALPEALEGIPEAQRFPIHMYMREDWM